MVVKFYSICLTLVFLMFYSCKLNENKRKEELPVCYSWEIKNVELKKQIMKYFETIDSAGFKGDVLWIKVIDNPPFVKYNLVFANEISIFLNGQVHILTEVEDKKIGVSFNRINPYMNDFMLSDESLIKFMKNNFAEDFQYYKRALQRIKRDSDYYEKKYHLRDALPMPSKREPESWELTFRDGKLIDKKVTR